MPTLEDGFARSVSEVIGGVIVSFTVEAFAKTGLIAPSFIMLFYLVNAASMVAMASAVPRWGTGYIFGWLIGAWVLSKGGLLDITDYAICAIAILVLLLRMKKTMSP